MSAGPTIHDEPKAINDAASPLAEVSGEDYVPYIKPEEDVPEFTLQVLILGLCQAVFFGLADGYLGLKIGLTVSASIPAAVISMAILRGVLKRGSVLENNLVQNMASVGESLAAGAVFTLPALYLLQDYLVKNHPNDVMFTPDWFKSFFIACLGGVLGILFMIPLRRYLIVKEHGKLRYPEGTACAEVLMAGDEGGAQARTVFSALGVAGVYRFFMSGLKLFPENIDIPLPQIHTALSFDMLPSLLAVGFIIGLRTCGIMLAGAFLGWFVIIPLIAHLGAYATSPIPPEAVKLIKDMGPGEIRLAYLRYIGAGAVAMGGIISLCRALPTIVDSFGTAIKGVISPAENSPEQDKRTFRDMPFPIVMGGIVAIFLILGLFTSINPSGFLGAFLAVVFAFFFVTVSSRIVGIVGSTSMPLSGMTIGALLATCGILKLFGWSENPTAGMAAALVIACIVCIAISMGGDISQDLKIGFLVGATPRWVQITQLIAVTISAMSVAVIVHGFAGGVISHKFEAPQANLMFELTKGIMEGKLPWMLVILGMGIAIMVEMMDIGALPFAIGLYLPLDLSTTIVFGGLIQAITMKILPVREHKAAGDRGLLAASGMVAGDALVGVGLGLMTLVAGLRGADDKWDVPWLFWGEGGKSWIDANPETAQWVTGVLFALLCVYLWRAVMSRGKHPVDENIKVGVKE